MSGHSKWSQIKHKKGVADQKRGQLFSKLLKAVSIAAKIPRSQSDRDPGPKGLGAEPNPQFNPRLRSAIEKAKENNVPQESIERAINKAAETKNLEELVIEAYGPEGAALIIEVITDNKNRSIAEIKNMLNDHKAKMADPGSVLWAFEKLATGEWKPKFPQAVSESAKEKIKKLIDDLDKHDDVQKVITNVEGIG